MPGHCVDYHDYHQQTITNAFLNLYGIYLLDSKYSDTAWVGQGMVGVELS